jgi:hypothetical protein
MEMMEDRGWLGLKERKEKGKKEVTKFPTIPFYFVKNYPF